MPSAVQYCTVQKRTVRHPPGASDDAQEYGVPARNKSTFKTVRNKRAARKRTGKMVSPQVFDPEAFLTTVGTGRTIAVFKPKDYIFRQGTKCDAVFYIQK